MLKGDHLRRLLEEQKGSRAKSGVLQEGRRRKQGDGFVYAAKNMILSSSQKNETKLLFPSVL